MELDFTPQERFAKISEILAEGVLTLIAMSSQLLYLKIGDMNCDISLNQGEVLFLKIGEIETKNS